MKFEDLQSDATVRGILPDALVTAVCVEWHGSDARLPSQSSAGSAKALQAELTKASHRCP